MPSLWFHPWPHSSRWSESSLEIHVCAWSTWPICFMEVMIWGVCLVWHGSSYCLCMVSPLAKRLEPFHLVSFMASSVFFFKIKFLSFHTKNKKNKKIRVNKEGAACPINFIYLFIFIGTCWIVFINKTQTKSGMSWAITASKKMGVSFNPCYIIIKEFCLMS